MLLEKLLKVRKAIRFFTFTTKKCSYRGDVTIKYNIVFVNIAGNLGTDRLLIRRHNRSTEIWWPTSQLGRPESAWSWSRGMYSAR